MEAFRQTVIDYLLKQEAQQIDVGSTASIVFVLDDVLFVANIGDSRVIGSMAGLVVPLSTDHTPDQTDEHQRIKDTGGYVTWAGGWRVGGVLPFSRAFGYKRLKSYVMAEPGIEVQEISDVVDFIIIATAGLWSTMSNEEPVIAIQSRRGAEEVS
ncbi:hypothetical protein RJ639_001643 [Escallonia herrerae]|uniref:PPM-type phosphatase domain-containing protein n=1 Tax=Escallonia herrerae TaxID=1293975 RepID=A0AA88XIU5_9ASTE|nr:hypothetical protein RJ639_001643 [Escallonia herrerae]